MSTRRELLTRLFQLLEDRRAPWCVLRNYENLFEESTSDVDLITLPDRAEDVIACCREAAAGCGYRLVQRARFVNHSLVFWNGADRFVRIDVDTEKRWRRFHLLKASQIIEARRRRENFFVPDAAHEAVIVLTQALWQGKLSGRYAKRLIELRSELGNSDQLRAVFGEAFGLRENLLATIEDPGLPDRLARSVRNSVFFNPSKLFHSLRYLLKDSLRLLSRRKSPPGALLRFIGGSENTARDLIEKLAILFPVKKSLVSNGPTDTGALSKALFTGGLVVECLPAAGKPAPMLRRWPHRERSFAAISGTAGDTQFIHAGSGLMQSGDSVRPLTVFICEMLAREYERAETTRRGAFAVLLGLDGAGKTTLARNIATLAAATPLPAGVRYFHWLPPLRDEVEFPLPEPGNQPRKTPQSPGALQSLLSVARLGKNCLRARVSWWLRLKPALDRGQLVLVDRYFYNYHLDPVSVKYHGPRWALEWVGRLFPKPGIVITLSAPADVLLRRKQELSEQEIREQAATLARLNFSAARVIAADAREPADVVAQKVMTAIREVMR